MITEEQRLKLHQQIENCQSLRELKDLARALLEREVERQRTEADIIWSPALRRTKQKPES